MRRPDLKASMPIRTGLSAALHRRCRFADLLSLVVFTVWSLTLPVRLAPEMFQAVRAAAMPGAMTIGCSMASCCTPRCYLDENGAHHCVPDDGQSCGCGLSSDDKSTPQLPFSETATLQSLQTGVAEPGHSRLPLEFPRNLTVTYLTPLTPPPKA